MSGRELQREKAWSRIHLVPLLMAEGDRDGYRRKQAAQRREEAIMQVSAVSGGSNDSHDPDQTGNRVCTRYSPPSLVVL